MVPRHFYRVASVERASSSWGTLWTRSRSSSRPLRSTPEWPTVSSRRLRMRDLWLVRHQGLLLLLGDQWESRMAEDYITIILLK